MGGALSEIVYDVTRIYSRLYQATPNGIDRIDLGLARGIAFDRSIASSGVIFTPALGYFHLTRGAVEDLIGLLERSLGETLAGDTDPAFHAARDWLVGPPDAPAPIAKPTRTIVSPGLGPAAFYSLRHARTIARGARRSTPKGARLINVSQFPLARPGALDWLAARRDLKPVFYVHDLLPLEFPEYFRPIEYERHTRRMRNVARLAAGAIVSTNIMAEALANHLAKEGRHDLPILVESPPLSPLFQNADAADPALLARPYFVQCGTLEPRKNHLMTLHVWRELVNRHGKNTPKLLIIGARGWENENILDLVERCGALRDHVMEVSGLRTPGLVALMKGARAVLMPSFAEGYGLPLAESLALGTPVIASNIPVFHEIAGGQFTALSPIDGEGWLRAIESFMPEPHRATAVATPAHIDAAEYARRIVAFAASL